MKRIVYMLLTMAMLLGMVIVSAAADEVKLPKFQYKSNDYVSYLGKETYIEMKVTYGGTLPADATIELRDADGSVWVTKAFKSSMKNIGFRFTPTEEQLGGHTLNLWYGDEKLTQDDLRIYISDRSKKPVQQVALDQPYMSISLDCGYEGKNTDMVLGVLEEYGIKVTFFFTGYFVKNFPEEAAKIRDAGHEIGNHTMWHLHLTQESRATQIKEIIRTSEYIQEQLDVVPRVFRPPFGDIDSAVTAIVRAGGMEAVLWTIDAHDWDTKYNAEKILKRVTKDIQPGTIILFHLDGRFCEQNLRGALDYYIKELQLNVIPITELLEMSGWEMPKNPYLQEDDTEATPMGLEEVEAPEAA